ncbi:unnamed protein product [Sympodiomycopsis kandeliae]
MSASTLRYPTRTNLLLSPARQGQSAIGTSERSPSRKDSTPCSATSPDQSARGDKGGFNPASSQSHHKESTSPSPKSGTFRALDARPSMSSPPPLKRSHSAVSEAAERSEGHDSRADDEGRDSNTDPPGRGSSKIPKLAHPREEITNVQPTLSGGEGDDGTKGEEVRRGTSERNYVWQSARTNQTSGRGISVGDSPFLRDRNMPADDDRRHLNTSTHLPPPSLPSPDRSGRGRMIDNRLPSFASLSHRPTSPPPQVARYNAERSFVSGNPALSGAGGAGRSLAHFHASHRGSSPHSNYAGQYPGQSMGAASGSPMLAAHTVQGCPPIHPSLIGLPGSGTGPGNKQQPSFVAKLYSMLEDDATGNMITWGPSGDVFSVANPSEFSRVILPSWFKHANWQSFVRQLNMYGFHKVNHTFTGSPNEEVQIWEFKHPSFRRGAIHLLADIKRKSSRHKRTGSQSQSFSGSLQGTDFDGRRSRSSTPMETYGLGETSYHSGGPGQSAAHASHPRYRPYAEMDYGEPMLTHSRVRSLTDAAMRPPRSFAQAGEMVGSEAGSGRPIGAGEEFKRSPRVETGGTVPLPLPPRDTFADEGMRVVQAQDQSARMKDLSDRVDAIIRHSNYLEDQVRFLSDRLEYQEQRDRTVSIRLARIVNRLANVYALSDRDEGATPQDTEAIKARSLDVTFSEINQLHSMLALESGALSPRLPQSRSAGSAVATAPGQTATTNPALVPSSSSSSRGGSLSLTSGARTGPAISSRVSELHGQSGSPSRASGSDRLYSGAGGLGASNPGSFAFPRR